MSESIIWYSGNFMWCGEPLYFYSEALKHPKMQVRKASLEEIKRISSKWKIFRKYNREADDTEVIGQGRDQAKLFSYLPWTKLFMGRKPFETLSSIILPWWLRASVTCVCPRLHVGVRGGGHGGEGGGGGDGRGGGHAVHVDLHQRAAPVPRNRLYWRHWPVTGGLRLGIESVVCIWGETALHLDTSLTDPAPAPATPAPVTGNGLETLGWRQPAEWAPCQGLPFHHQFLFLNHWQIWNLSGWDDTELEWPGRQEMMDMTFQKTKL